MHKADQFLVFNLTVCDGSCAEGYVGIDEVTITYAAFSYPEQPTLYTKDRTRKRLGTD